MNRRRDWTTDAGLLVVGVAAGILTFTTLRDLAVAVGITGTFAGIPLSYLVPVTIDAAGVVAARVWLRRAVGREAVRFARCLAWACIGASIVGNAGQHGMAAYGVAPPWWVVVLVTAIPPATLGAVVHLGHLTRRADDHQVAQDRHPVDHEVAQVAPTVAVEVAEVANVATPLALVATTVDDRARDLIAEGAGRKTLVRELGVTEYQARQYLKANRGVAS